MRLRFKTLQDIFFSTTQTVKKTLFFLMVLFSCPLFSQDDLKKESSKLFEDENYSAAYKLYSQLVANYPKDPEYNYKLGVCMIFSEPDKKKCLPYLQFAKRNTNDNTKDVAFWMGRAFHINYLFDEAIKNYDEYKLNASSAKVKKLQVDREIKACYNGKKLFTNLTDLVITSKKELNESDYFRSYDLKDIGGKLLVKPDDFKSSADKKKKENSVVFLPKNSNRVYYSSYGDKPEIGRDIYYAVKLADGTFSKGEKVKGINTEFDEDYPFLHPNGQTLYFASKGHNGMGGYDIFKSTYVEASDSWTTPENLEFPINSPDDDYLFVTDSLEKTAFFSTGRQSVPGKIDVLKINTERKPIDVLVIKGAVAKESTEQGAITIGIKNTADDSSVGTFRSDDAGNYNLELPNGAKLLFTVETPGQTTQSEEVLLPLTSVARPFRQEIAYEAGKLKITNYFDEPTTEDNYLQYLKVIEKKARLNVNVGENKLASTGTKATTTDAVVTNTSATANAPSAEQTTTSTATVANKGLDNKQLSDIAKQDAAELQQEATQLTQDSKDALKVGTQQKENSEKKLAEANELFDKAANTQDESEKKTLLENANQLKQESEQEMQLATKILTFGKSLEEDAALKQKEAQLNASYAQELEKAITNKTNTKESQTKLEDLQKEITALSEQKNKSEDIFSGIKTDIDDKEKQLAKIEQQNTDINLNLTEIKTVIAESEAELAKTKKKKDKETISNQIADLKTEQTEKENQIVNNGNEIKKINEELVGLKNELGLASKIKTEVIVPVDTKTTAIAANTNTKTTKPKPNNQVVTSAKQPEKTTKTTPAKTPVPVKAAGKPDYQPLTASTASEAISRLDNLNTQLGNVNDNEVFDFNGYQNPLAQNLKIEADAKINEAAARQKKLKESIVSSKESITNIPSNKENKITQAQLSKEADDLVIKAQAIRNDAEKQTGDKKEKLMAEAKTMEMQADEKYIQASEITKNDNRAIFENNINNFDKLIAENKSGLSDVATARKLKEEAALSFKQATAIREEAASLTSAGAKLGSISNAEEIEAEALIKQQQSVDILRLSNPTLALSSPITSTSAPTPGVADPTDIANGLQKVNTEVSDLATIKIQSYQKLFDANVAEIEQTTSSISSNQTTLDKTPGLKNEYTASTAKLETVRTLKQKSDEATVPGEKLAGLTEAIKKQVEVIKQLNKVNTSLNKIVSANTVIAAQTPTVPKVDPPANTTVSEPTNTLPTPAKPENVAVDLQVIESATLAKEDTTSAQLVNYFEKSVPALKNAQADALVKKSLTDIKTTDREIQEIDEKINNYQPGNNVAEENPKALKTKADGLLVEAETLSGEAFAARKEANEKSGAEKDALIAKADDLENQSQNKKLEASELTLTANTQDYKTNNEAINELLEKVKADNPTLAAEFQSKINETKIMYDQTKQLREEANSLSNTSAKLGALSNAEEKEVETALKQNQLLDDLKKLYPDYVVKTSSPETPESLRAKKDQLLEKQYTDLTNLTNSFSLEFESSKNLVPETLSTEKSAVKQNADDLNAESKQLLIKASQEKDPAEKNKLLSRAAKLGSAAVTQLNKIIPEKAVVTKNTKANETLKNIGKDITAANTKKNKTVATENTAATNARDKTALKVQGLDVLKGNAYSAARPIPIDGKIEDGLVFRVQIGAFKTRLPDNSFRGLTPLNGETTNSGYIRYTAGNFNKVENANAVKNDLRRLGYKDAFVVVYYNGKRISLNEALEIMGKEGKSADMTETASAGIDANSNIPKAANPPQNTATEAQDKVVVTKELEELNGLLYTVQIGVYTKQTTNAQLLNLKPIFTERLTNGLYRYTAGIYNNADRLISDKNKVIQFGVKDAFVSAYLNGKRIPFAEGKTLQAEDSTIKMEAENPIVFAASPATTNNVVEQTPVGLSAVTATVQPFTNSVSSYPAATEDNGVKVDENGITFKVQIGAYSKQVPEDIAAKFSEIKTWPIDNKQSNGLYIYNIGNFSEPKFAKALKEEVMKLGITDAFITVYRDGVKLYGTEASSLLSR